MRWLPICFLFAACQGMPSGGDDEVCSGEMTSLSCQGDEAEGMITFGATTSATIACARDHDVDEIVTCPGGGCYLQVQTTQPFNHDGEAILDPAALCTKTPVAQAGDACDAAQHPCLPTRVQLAADGTVAGQDYLACDNGTCVAAPPPVVASYLQACAAEILARETAQSAAHADVDTVDNFNGGWCLVAWDDAAQRAATGVTIACMGDWDCPAQSLCDDRIPLVGATADRPGVCKPGPKGTLTPAMLSE